MIEEINNLKNLAIKNKDKLVLFFKFFVISALFFGLGNIYGQNLVFSEKSLKIGQNEQILVSISAYSTKIENITKEQQALKNNTKEQFLFVASKNGKTYYKISCKNRIKEENKIYFQTEQDAKKAGYRRSKTCFK